MEQEDAMGQGCRASAGPSMDPGQEQTGLLQVGAGACLLSQEVTVCIWPSPGQDGDSSPVLETTPAFGDLSHEWQLPGAKSHKATLWWHCRTCQRPP